MKKLVKVEEVAGEGLIGLMGEDVLILCMNYFYAGKLIGVNEQFIQLENVHIVYETGSFSNKAYTDAQKISDIFYIQLSAVESYGKGKAV